MWVSGNMPIYLATQFVSVILQKFYFMLGTSGVELSKTSLLSHLKLKGFVSTDQVGFSVISKLY